MVKIFEEKTPWIELYGSIKNTIGFIIGDKVELIMLYLKRPTYY
ncbi:MAG: hypothetical protein ACTSPD_09610 [Promethearchaeota archaeon]